MKFQKTSLQRLTGKEFKDLWIVTHLSSFYSRVPKYFGDHEIMNEEKVREVKMEPALELSTVPSDHKFKNPGFYKENINWKQHSLILEFFQYYVYHVLFPFPLSLLTRQTTYLE